MVCRVGGLAAIYRSGATNGAIPNASAHVTNNLTAIFDIGYNIMPNTYVVLMGGYPSRPELRARGTVSAFGDLGAVTYGPMILTGGYRFPVSGWLHPYAGAGAAYAIILKNHNGTVQDLYAHNNFGYTAQAGVEDDLSNRVQFFADLKELSLHVHARGALGG